MTWMHKLLRSMPKGPGQMPPSFDEFPKFHEGIREHDEFFRAVEEGKIVVRWGRSVPLRPGGLREGLPVGRGWCVIDGAMRKVTRERAAQYLQEP